MVWHITQKYFQTALLSLSLSLSLFYKKLNIILIAIILFHLLKPFSILFLIYRIIFSFFWLDDFLSAYKWSSHSHSPDQTSYCFCLMWYKLLVCIDKTKRKVAHFLSCTWMHLIIHLFFFDIIVIKNDLKYIQNYYSLMKIKMISLIRLIKDLNMHIMKSNSYLLSRTRI